MALGPVRSALRSIRSGWPAFAVLACGSSPGRGQTSTSIIGAPDAGTCPSAVARLIDDTGIVSFEDAGSPFGVAANVDLAIAGSDLYYTVGTMAFGTPNGAPSLSGSRTNLVRLSLQGGPPNLVASLLGTEQALLLLGTSAFLAISSSEGADGQIVAVPLDGRSSTVLAGTKGTPARTLAALGSSLVFADDEGIKSIALSGGVATVLSSHTGTFALVGDSLFIADSSAQSIYNLPLGRGTETPVATGQAGVDLPFPCGAGICWTTHTNPANGTQGTAAVVELLAGGAPQPVATSPLLFRPWRLLFNSPYFYVTVLGDAMFGTLLRVTTDGNAPLQLAPVNGLAVNGQCLYAGGASGIYSMSLAYAATYDGGSGSP